MVKPFEGLLGTSKELRVLDFLIQMESFSFNISELESYVGISWPTASRITKLFKKHGMVKVKDTRGRASYYSINKDSPFVQDIESFNNHLIESLLDKKILQGLQEQWKERMKGTSREVSVSAETGLASLVTFHSPEENDWRKSMGLGYVPGTVTAKHRQPQSALKRGDAIIATCGQFAKAG